ncbi:hypothetical protein NW851_05770 [Synechococcus sp. H55.7]|uniref:hypothetical protein n=1 Tax=unclassified Synechococcus TaxID=2626047 RepID=UPI0039C4E2A9
MISQPLNTGRGRRPFPLQSKTATLPARRHPRTVAHASKVSRPQPLKSAHPHSRDPVWKKHLVRWQQISTGMAIVSGLAVLGLYSWTVHTQSQWSQRYQVWQQMQRNERQFLLAQESIANALREVADRSDMVPLVPERMIEVPFASPGPVEPHPGHQAALRAASPTEKAPPFYPVGY